MSLRTLAIIGGALIVALLLVLGWESGWGRAIRKAPPPVSMAALQPLDVTLLPEYKMGTALAARKDTVERPLFVPTRRPAPPEEVVASEEGPKKVQRGLFILSGTAIQGETRIAFLRNAKDNKPKTVRVGDVVEGMTVSVVAADRVKLTASGEEEELLLKVATGPKGAVTPAAPPQTPGGAKVVQPPVQAPPPVGARPVPAPQPAGVPPQPAAGVPVQSGQAAASEAKPQAEKGSSQQVQPAHSSRSRRFSGAAPWPSPKN